MRKSVFSLLVAGAVGILTCIAGPVLAADKSVQEPTGRDVVFDKKKGNCLACHAIPADPKAEAPGNIGPPFMAVKQRYPEREKLRAQIWDATRANPKTSMPPFGKHKILTESEVDKVTDYIYSL